MTRKDEEIKCAGCGSFYGLTAHAKKWSQQTTRMKLHYRVPTTLVILLCKPCLEEEMNE